MNFKDIVSRLYDLINDGIKIWVQGENVKVFIPEGVTFSEQQKEFITSNKSKILDCLHRSKVYSEDYNYVIFMEDSNSSVLSFAQERLWFIEEYEQGTNAYNIPMAFKLAKDAKLALLEKSINNIVARHEALRTVIKADNQGIPYQLVLDNVQCSLEVTRVTGQTQLMHELEKQVNHIYDLSRECPIRVCLYELVVNSCLEYYLSIVIHHIAFDDWSINVFLEELQSYYRYYSDLAQGLTPTLNLSTLEIQYRDFALWQRSYLSGNRLAGQLKYWKEKLAECEILSLPTDKLRPSQIDYKGRNKYFHLDKDVSEGLRTIAKELEVSLYSVLLSSYYLMLRAHSNQDDIVVGTPIANRHYTQIENLIGFFVNTLALRTKIDSKELIKDFIKRVGKAGIEAQLYQDLPFEKLVDELKITRDPGRNPIFQVMFGVQKLNTGLLGYDTSNSPLQAYKEGLELYNAARFDISTFIDDSQVELRGVFNYMLSLYTEETISRFIETYTQILKQFAALAHNYSKLEQTRIKDLSYLSPEQYHQVVRVWNQTDREYPKDKTIHQLFEEQVEKTPDNIAVVYEETKLTYRRLNERANQLASYIRQAYDIKPDTLVALCLDRSEHMLIAILAILKAGGAYVPMDPGYPDERIEYILKDTSTRLVLTNEIYKQKLKELVNNICSQKIEIIAIDNNSLQEQLLLQLCNNPQQIILSTNLAYVIYTSGTTGHPKGVMIEHRGIVNRIKWMNDTYPLSEGDRILQKTPYVFDVSVWELLWANWYGATIVFAKAEGHKDASYLIELINKEAITILHFVPSMLGVFEHTLRANRSALPSLRYIFCSGEALSLAQVKECNQLLPHVEVHNLYGPTEASVDVLCYNCNTDIEQVYIGKPIDNSFAYVLDHGLTPLPIGAIGELYIGGVGLARGYLNKPELTAERFIENLFQTEEEKTDKSYSPNGRKARLYKTGDLVRWGPDGNLEYIGRNDFQVKIRGYRIELEEVENALSSYEGITQSVVVAREHHLTEGESVASKYLVGYYVADSRLDEAKILRYLQSKLPDYMVPSALVHLEKLPHTINGKLDRRALPDPEFTSSAGYMAPRNEVEGQVCQIWAEVLGLSENKVGIQDDFFKLGGDSIISIQLVSRMRQRLGLEVSVKDIFNYKSIEKLYNNVLSKNIAKNVELKTEQGVLSGKVDLLPIQQWFLASEFVQLNHWNQSFMVKIPDLDIAKLQASISKLIEHHDGLRLRFKKAGNCAYAQYYAIEAKVEEVRTLDIRTIEAKEGSNEFNAKSEEILTKWQSDFNIERGPVYSIGYLYGYKDGSCRLCFALHHLIVDTVSWRILAEDLRDLYNDKELGSKGSSYRQWVSTVAEYASKHDDEREYWANVLADYGSNKERLNRLIVSEDTRNHSSLELSKQKTQELLQQSNRAYNTQINDLLLTAIGYALFEITGSNVNHIVVEGHGREELDNSIDITRTVGWFTTMYPVRLEVDKEPGNSIKHVKESLRQIPNKGIGYGALIGYQIDALPRISFNYLGQFGDNKQQGFWHIIGEGSGTAVHAANYDHHIININGFVVDERLQFHIASKLEEKATNELAKKFKQKLEEVIDYTVNQERSYLTVSDVGRIISAEYLDKIQEDRDIEGVYLANSLQQGFVYHTVNQGDIDDAYRVQIIWEYHVQLDVEKLKQAWSYAQAKYPSLRLRFKWDEQLVQIIDKEGKLDWRYIDLSNELDQEIKIRQIQEADRGEAYKLEEGNLLRIYIIKQKDDLYTCIFSNHHAILDGWSGPVLLGYIHEVYLKLVAGEKIEIALDYSYINAQQYLQEHKEDNKDYWDKYISQIEERVDLSGLLSGNKNIRISEYRHIIEPAEKEFIIECTLYEQMKILNREEGVTLNAILQYAWHKVLNVYGNSNQTVVGTTISGRNLPVDNIEHSVGLYINTLPLIVDHRNQVNKNLLEAIREIQDNISEINSRSDVSLAKLQKGGDRLFDSLFVYESYPSPVNEEQESKVKIKFKEAIEKLDYPIGVIAYEANDQLVFVIKYAGELFNKESITNLLTTLKVVLEGIAVNPKQNIQSLRYLSLEQYHQVVREWNQTDREYPDNKTIHQLFEEQAEKTPDNIAVVYEENKLTYRQLNERANQLASYIRQAYDIKPDTLVALCLDRSEHMLIAILAVLKAGGAYVPMDPSYPDERIEYILRDTSTRLVLTNEKYKQRLEELVNNIGSQKIGIAAIDNNSLQKQLLLQLCNNPQQIILSTNLAYVIYTSGTTGNPKGVMIEHRGVVSLVKNVDYVNINSDDTFIQFADIAFDAATFEIYGALLNGSKLYIPYRTKDLISNFNLFHKILITQNVTILWLTKTLFDHLLLMDESIFKSIKYLLVGGEALNRELMVKLLNSPKPTNKVINGYGPTENTTFSCTLDIDQVNISNISTIPIGAPLTNRKAYILDPNLNPVPIGATGELYVGGVGLARGYLNRPELTAERFIKNPFQTEEEKADKSYGPNGRNARLYKTGDLVRWLTDGSIEYIGRNDFQVKIRGYRIELGEIENAFLSYKGVKQSVVLAKEHHQVKGESAVSKYLVGYYISDSRLDEAEILKYLQLKLPEYMVPSALVHLEKLPLTINGKLDRRALPEPELTNSAGYMAPRNEIEGQVCQIWAEVLGLLENKVGIQDDFFRLGGDSIISIQLVSRMRQRLEFGFVSIKDIFSYRTIEKLYDNVIAKNLGNSSNVTITSEQGILSGEVPLLAVQRWFFDSKFTDPSYWNQSFLIKTPKLNFKTLKAAITALIHHHDAFRLRYKSEFIQYYDDKAKEKRLKVLDVNMLSSREEDVEFKEELSSILTSWQSEFNLEDGPTYSIGYLFGFKDGSTKIFFALHHLIIDTVSWRILTEDLRELYYKAETGKCLEELNLGHKGTSYRQWVEVANSYKDSHEDERSYWINVLTGIEDSNKKLEKLIVREDTINSASLKLSIEQTKHLLQGSSKAFNTQINDLLLTALSLSLKEVLKTRVNYITLEGHGREENIVRSDTRLDITRTMGWFTTMYPVRLEVSEDKDESTIIANTIKYIKETLRQVPNNGIGFGSIIGYDTNLLPKISFNYLGQLDQIKETTSGDNGDSWHIVDESSGISVSEENKDKNIISINGAVINEQLEFFIESYLGDDVTHRLASSFKEKQEEIINYVISLTRTYLTVSDVGRIVSAEYLDKIQEDREIEGVYLANSLQQGFIHHALNQGDIDDAYRVQIIWEYHVQLDVDKLKQAWSYAQAKYPSLRLRFRWDEQLIQVIDKEGKLDWRYIDLSNELDQEVKIRQIQEADRGEAYNLEEGNLFRVYLIKQSNSLYTCIFSNHHAIIDGWSIPILLGYIHATYVKLTTEDQDKTTVDTSIDKTYLNTQEHLQKTLKDNEEYWKKYISKIEERLNLSTLILDTAKKNHDSYNLINKYKHVINPQSKNLIIRNVAYNKLKTLSKEQGITLNAIFQYAWHKVLKVYGSNNNQDITTVVGITVAGRNLPIDGIEKSVGLYINTLPLIVEHDNANYTDSTIIEAIRKLQDDIAEINTKSNINLSKLQKDGERIFDTLFVFENYPVPTKSGEDGADNDNVQLKIDFKESVEKADYPLVVIAYENEQMQELIFTIKYAGELFEEQTIEQLLATVNTILTQVAEQIEELVNKKITIKALTEKDLYYLTKDQQELILMKWNKTDAPYPHNKTINELFEEQVKRKPNNIAVIDVGKNGRNYKYSMLLTESNTLARYIILHNKDHKLKNIGHIIGILSEKGYNQVVCSLSIMRSGGCYLPLNVDWTVNKITDILNEGKVSTLFISQDQYKNKKLRDILSKKYNLIVIEDILQEIRNIEYIEFLRTQDIILPKLVSNDIAYVIFTSGSTGKPKGVTITHKGAINTIHAINKEFSVDGNDKILGLSEFSFDLSIYDIFGMLFTGGSIIFPDQSRIKDVSHWWNLINEYRISIWNTVPQLANLLISEVNNYYKLSNPLRLFLLSGDYVPKQLSNTIMYHLKKAKVISLGGATEGSIWSIWYKIPSTNQQWEHVPYGFPMPNQKMHILNSYMQCCPVGAIGEIYIGGAGVASNYWNNPKRTDESFIEHPSLGKIYKTGDLGKWSKNGYIEYIGRTDFQVKIRGYRIELGEIESSLLTYSDIKQCVVIAKEHKTDVDSTNKYLVAYYTTISGEVLEESSLISYLSTRLPDYMVPSAFIYLNRVPLTINGKLDRNALPDPEIGNSANTYVSPRNELESEICTIFAEVLGLDVGSVGICDDFFRMGGNSIISIRLISRLRQRLNLNITVKDIFTNRTIEKLIGYLESNVREALVIGSSKVGSDQDQVLSFAQERLWFIEKYEEGTNVYNIPMIYRISEDTIIPVLIKSIDSIIKRHAILRTFIKEDSKGNSYQLISNVPIDIQEIEVEDKHQLDIKLSENANYVYDLSNEYPIRIKIYRLNTKAKHHKNQSQNEYYLSITIHHIAFDGWSENIFFKELEEYYRHYNNESRGIISKVNLPELTVQYKDFALWQKSYLTGEVLDKQLSYWKNKLTGHETLNLITDTPRPLILDYEGKSIEFELGRELSCSLRATAKHLGVSLYSLLLAGYYLMLRIYSNQDDIVIGVPVANRHHNQIEHLIGFFINTLVLRITIDSSAIILKDFIKYVGDEIVNAQINQDLPFEKLVEELNVSKDISRHPIFQVMFVVQNFGGEFVNKILEPYRCTNVNYSIAKFDLETSIDDSKDILKGIFNYRVNLYNKDTIQRFIDTYKEILTQFGAILINSEIRIKDISYLTNAQQKLILSTWNDTDASYPSHKTVHQIFEEQVERTPDNIAVVCDEVKLTYKELNEKANRLAHYLIKYHNVKPDTLVALFLDRSEHMIIAILAILKAGGAYVPLSPSYPNERVKYILEDIELANSSLEVKPINNKDLNNTKFIRTSTVIITNKIYKEELDKITTYCKNGNGLSGNKKIKIQDKDCSSNLLNTISIICSDSTLLEQELSKLDITTPKQDNLASCNLAYVIYTSGTTGNPKGVMIEHRSVVNLAIMQGKEFGLATVDINTSPEVIKNCLCYANYIFDASVSEIFTSILNGHKIYLLSDHERLNFDALDQYIRNNKIDIATIPPALLNSQSSSLNLNTLVVAGEKISSRVFYYYLQNNKKIINAYGPTETTVCSSLYHYKKNDTVISNIGCPLSNTKAYVLSSSLVPLPIGAVGELYIGGIGLARGYLNNPSLTNERFVPNPFQTEEENQDKTYGKDGKNSRLYKTGDLVRWLPDGNIEYIGRNDFQVKIRGYRIELGEIESTLSTYSDIKQCVIIAKEHKTDVDSTNKYLVAYYTTISGEVLEESSLISYLSTRLPDYMIPSAFVYLEKFPLTINGKLDRNALPGPGIGNSADTYFSPRNELESQICTIFGEVLGLDIGSVGIRDDFFRMGGDSIISIRLISRLRQRLNLNITVKDIFTYKSIERLYDNVVNKELSNNNIRVEIKSEQDILSGELSLLPIQRWFFASNFKEPNHWNQSFIIKTPTLEIERLRSSIIKLTEHHDVFRLKYKNTEQGWKQYYDNKSSLKAIKQFDISNLKESEIEEILTEMQSDFDIEQGPLYNISYLYGYKDGSDGYKDGSARICFSLHHLIVDTVSWRIILEDLKTLYVGKNLGNKGSSYRQWVEVANSYKDSHADERSYWINVLTNIKDSNKKLKKLIIREDSVNSASLKLSIEQTKHLLQGSSKAFNTQINDLLLTALSLSLKEVLKTRVNYITLEGHGREDIDKSIDITRTMGWFTTMYPVRLEVCDITTENKDESTIIANTIKYIKETLRQVPNNGIGFGSIIGYDTNLLPKISFNYLGQLDQIKETISGDDVGSWHIIDEPSGMSVNKENKDKNIISINGGVINEQLEFTIESYLGDDVTHRLASSFKEKQEEIINYATSLTRTYLTISDVGRIVSAEYLDKIQEDREIEGVYLANSLQQGFIHHALNQGDIDDAYRVQIIWEYHVQLDVDKLKQAWSYAQAKYPSLRLRFKWDEQLVQVIDKEGKLDWRYIDLSNELDQEVKIRQIQEADRGEAYKLEEGNLFRVYIIKQKDDLYTCIFSNHHAILDGWSGPVLLGYIHEVYLKLVAGEKIEIALDYSYINAQQYLQEHKEDNKDYWDKYISQLEERVDLSGLLSGNKNVRISEYKHIIEPAEEEFIIEGKLYERMKILNREEGVTLNAILQYAWHKILNIYGNSNQTVVGTTISGRNLPVDNIEHSVGLYINTLPLIVDHRNQVNKNLIEAIREIQDNISEINSRSDISLAKLQKGGERLFDSLFVYESYPSPVNKEQESKVKLKFKEAIEKLDYPIGVIAYEANDQLVFVIKYAGELFNKESITNLLTTLKVVLEEIAVNPKQNIQSLSYLSPEQYHQVVKEWNQTDREYPDNKTIHQLFEEQAEKTPDNIAVVYEETKLTYRQLNERANQLASYIRQAYDIKPDTLVALCLDRSEHMLIAILAILKVGGAYVPIDPGYPDERIEYILKDTATRLILTNEMYKGRLEEISAATSTSSGIIGKKSSKQLVGILDIDSQDLQEKLTVQYSANPITNVRSNNLAYVIYTSGTTGHPKGVMIEHKGIVNRIKWMNDTYPLSEGDKILQKTPYVFDVSVWELLWANWYGATIVFAKVEGHKDASYLIELIKKEAITILHFVPSMLGVFEHTLRANRSALPSLRYIFCSGETLSLAQVKECNQLLPHVEVHNLYGPTEASVDVLYYNCNKDIEQVYIGKPIDNSFAYVLGHGLTPLPVGAIGELYVGGVGLARGYLNRPELTAERFIDNPFQTEEEKADKSYGPNGRNARLYKTGDLVRWVPDGNLEYIERNDFQVKIRGYRIELGEIESTLSTYSDIKQCVVVIKEHKTDVDSINKYLVAYYTTTSSEVLEESFLVSYLSIRLPDYMIPSAFVYLEKLPLTINCKLDRKALPEPEFTNSAGYIAPRNEVEGQVCQIWAEVLGLPENKVGIQDNFFRLGGDSIISIQLVSRMRQRLGLKVSVKDIFSYKSIEKLYNNVIAKNLDNSFNITITSEQGILSGEVPLLAVQRWFFDSKFTDPPYWNQSFLIKAPKLNIKTLKAAITALTHHHDAFRLRYKNESIQYYDDKAKEEELRVLDVNMLSSREEDVEFKEELSSILTSWQSEFNLEDGPTYSIGYLFGFKDGSTKIFFALHHLIIDTVSWRILTEDLRELYYKAETGKCLEELNLGHKGTSYRQWVEVANSYKDSHEDERSYWINALTNIEDSNKKLESLIDRNTNSIPLSTFSLSKKLTTNLLKESSKAYNTEINDLLLTALSLSLKEILKTRVNYITLEGHGREDIDKSIDITRTMGWFTTMYPVRLEVCDITTENKDESTIIANTIKYIKETLRQVPNNGIGFGSIIGYDTNLLPKISFNYLGQLDQIKQTISGDSRGFWSIIDEPSGISVSKENKDKNIINVNSAIINEQLEFIIESKLEINLHKKFIRIFNNNLLNIINHSVSKFFTEYTISDYKDFQPYVVYDKTPLLHNNGIFVMPPGEGGAESYFNNIVPGLSDTKLILFNNFIRYLAEHNPNQTKYITYEILAHNYIAYIKSIQAQGAYNLLGWSFGGVLAFEIAKQLIEQGDTVKSLTMIDSYFSFRTVISTNGWSSDQENTNYQENMNYKYSPIINNNKLKLWHNTNITLFKATEILSIDDYANQHYTNFTKHNYLDIIIGAKAFNTVEMPHSHISWVYDKNQIDQINYVISKKFKG